MRNSIQGPLLRTGQNSAFKALGETGYPVFKMAFQLREAIYRLDAGRNLARHLAVPQNDQGGDRTDWYSSFPGDVIPWSGASESEQASARQQFSEFQTAVQALSEQMLNADQQNAGGDRQVFAQLLKSAIHFPDYDFVYLVDGVLVITFWGFVHASGEPQAPMHWLLPSSIPQSGMNAVASQALKVVDTPLQPSPIGEQERAKQPRRWNWRWVLWLLLALFLLSLIFGLLRGCTPALFLSGQHAIPHGDGKISDVTPAWHSDMKAVRPSAETYRTADTVATGNIDSSPVAEVVDPHSHNSTHTTDASTPLPVTDDANTTTVDEPSPGNIRPDPMPAATAPLPQAAADQGKPLTLPPELTEGPAQFLNGKWRVNGGIQDKLTGRPLQLQYHFKQGNGTVSVRQSSGVTCTGSAMGNVQKGALKITNPKQMQCSDGSNFIVPTIECKSPSSGHADCVGSNDGDNTFPIRMLQPNN
ncbi:SrfA family protein [Cedecea sp. P7760]|uniref:SrfA family protein n=1 Tax=Cedecea sp. P7760 TaxID=2726983 RepID=UPI0015A27274|nr:SrfA family protein [Cedecea sp. P7760]NWC64566.1 hypothetical protein [Cedecea sp. P7760]